MKVVIHDRTELLPDDLRAYAEGKVGRLSRHFDGVLDTVVEFDFERHRSQEPTPVVRIIVHTDGHNGPVLRAQEDGVDHQAALDLALDKIDRQVVRFKERLKGRKAREVIGEPDRDGTPRVRPDRLKVHLRPQSPEQAREELDDSGNVFYLFLNEETGEVNCAYRRNDGSTAVIEPLVK